MRLIDKPLVIGKIRAASPTKPTAMTHLSHFVLAALLVSSSPVIADTAKPSPGNGAPFKSYYTVKTMQRLATAYAAVAGKSSGVTPATLAAAAEFRGYVLAKAESWNKDWRGKCSGPAGQVIEEADELVSQIAAVITTKVSAADMAKLDDSDVDVLVGFGVFGRCLSDNPFSK